MITSCFDFNGIDSRVYQKSVSLSLSFHQRRQIVLIRLAIEAVLLR